MVYYDQTHGNCEGAFEAFSPEWWEMLVFASQEEKRLRLTFETYISNGYVAGAMDNTCAGDAEIDFGGDNSGWRKGLGVFASCS